MGQIYHCKNRTYVFGRGVKNTLAKTVLYIGIYFYVYVVTPIKGE